MNTIYIKNNRENSCHSVRLHKVDARHRTLGLAGAVFDLLILDERKNVYCPLKTGLTTDADGILLVECLAPGKYKFIETKAPQGYAVGNDFETHFEIENTRQTAVIELTVINYRFCTSCTICRCCGPCKEGCAYQEKKSPCKP